MGLSFANPLAIWGLLGLPLILGLHFLQSRNRREEISSLFLLELLPEETRSGAVFSYIRNGLQLWMQLLSVLLLTWLLARPMWLRSDSIQSVAVVLDHSVSMMAFEREVNEVLSQVTEVLEESAGETEWWLEVSDPGRSGLAAAANREDLLAALETFQPRSGPHSPRQALLRARQLVGPEGLVLFVSDHPVSDPPAGALAISVGHPVENSGFTGIKIGEKRWQASLIHFGTEPVTKKMWVQFDEAAPEEILLTLTPGALQQVHGELPADFQRGILTLEGDAYALDDVLPFVNPLVKTLEYQMELPDSERTVWIEKLMQTLPGARLGEDPVLRWLKGWPLAETPETRAEIWFLSGDATAEFAAAVPGTGGMAAGLRWEGFLALPYKGFSVMPGDRVELWMGEEPLIIRRESAEGTRLLLNFDFAASNAERFPSMLLFLHRFIKQQRDLQPQLLRTQLETRQILDLPFSPNSTWTTTFEDLQGSLSEANWTRATAPDQPGYFQVQNGDQLILEAGVFSGDAGEGNFQEAGKKALPEDIVLRQRERNSQTDFLMPLGFALLCGALTLSWWSERAG